jgi:two-component system, chemotaxis family, protein-glutamate methylesterase/glutaminase
VKRARVLIVDDSALMREVLTQLLSTASDLEVVGAAPDPIRAMELIRARDPDVLTLDVEMPRMDGLAFLEQLMRERPMPVVMVSTTTQKGSQLALRALELGAIDVVEKPKLDVRAGTLALSEELIAKVRAAASARPRRPAPRAPVAPQAGAASSASSASVTAVKQSVLRASSRVIAIGASTGGTEALAVLLRQLPADAPALLLVQHMPAKFTGAFAERLNRECRLHVKEARDGDPVRVGCALLAPGDFHMRLVRSGAAFVVRLGQDAPVGLHRPAVDVLFGSCASAGGSACIGVILTGMGADGAAGLLQMRRAGSVTIAQDERTCVVFGMPKEAIARGAVQHVLPLEQISAAMLKVAAA